MQTAFYTFYTQIDEKCSHLIAVFNTI